MIDAVKSSPAPDKPINISMEGVLASLDQPAPDARALYYRWEQEQWEASVVDLARDAEDWNKLDEGARTSLRASLACVFPRGERLGSLLVPLVDAVDSEEEQVFLTSQLADQARGVVFAGRVTTEFGGNPAPNGKLEELFDLVEERADEVRVRREQSAALYEGMLLNNVIFEGVIVVSFLKYVDGYLDNAKTMPGLREGLIAVARDTTRHVLFGVRLLQEAVDRDHGNDAAAIESVIETALPVVNGVINEAAALSADFNGLPFDDNGISQDAMETLARRMHDIGIDLPT